MQVRLAFSIAIQARNDILIFDEVLAVGDEAFQQKCIKVFEMFKAAKQTIILVTHDMETVKRFCNRAMLIHDGKVMTIGSPFEVADQYSKINMPDTQTATPTEEKKHTSIMATYRDAAGNKKSRFSQNEHLTVDIEWPQSVEARNANILVFKNTGEYVFGTSTFDQQPGMAHGGNIKFELQLNLAPGSYRIEAGLFGDDRKNMLDYMSESSEFTITRPAVQRWSGLTNLDHRWVK
jgi:ABC-2 type transport system ATP-binding protein